MTRTTLTMPSFNGTAVGFERLFQDIERHLVKSTSDNYPPYNIVEVNENEWNITLAVAGFGMDNLNIVLDKNILTVSGETPKGSEELKYLHKGLASRSFRRSFTLADHIQVENATLELGLLHIILKRNVPEELQPKKISINTR